MEAGSARFAAGQMDEARHHFEHALASGTARSAEAHYFAGAASLLTHHFALAFDHFRNMSAGVQPLIIAANYGHMGVLRALLHTGAKVNAVAPVDGRSALTMAVFFGHVDAVRLLVAHGADVTHEHRRTGGTPLAVAMQRGHLEIASLLTIAGATRQPAPCEGWVCTEERRLAERRWRYPQQLDWWPDTAAWRRKMRRREVQIRNLVDLDLKQTAFSTLMHGTVLVPNLTRSGFEVVRTPLELQAMLQTRLEAGVTTTTLERDPALHPEMPVAPRFITSDPASWGSGNSFSTDEELNAHILTMLHPAVETWAAAKLTPVVAYGIRVYDNSSTFPMHVDKASRRPLVSFCTTLTFPPRAQFKVSHA